MERDISTQDSRNKHSKIEKNLHLNLKPKQIQPNPQKKLDVFQHDPQRQKKTQKIFGQRMGEPKMIQTLVSSGRSRSGSWYGCFRKWWVKTPQIIHLVIGFSIIFTIHFGVPLFLG